MYIKKLVLATYRSLQIPSSLFDRRFLAKDIPMSSKVSHANWKSYLYNLGNVEGMKILEIGSREVTGKSFDRSRFDKATYTGFDYYAGENVDVVGDVHKLSSYFDKNEKFDLIYTSACFEHFAMPWIVAEEISKLLKVDGYIFAETHFSFSSHERPWHFFQFSDMALKVLFNKKLGFECLETGMSNPIVGRFSKFADSYLRYRPVPGLYCHVEFLGQKVKEVNDFDWRTLNLDEELDNSKYPEPKK